MTDYQVSPFSTTPFSPVPPLPSLYVMMHND